MVSAFGSKRATFTWFALGAPLLVSIVAIACGSDRRGEQTAELSAPVRAPSEKVEEAGVITPTKSAWKLLDTFLNSAAFVKKCGTTGVDDSGNACLNVNTVDGDGTSGTPCRRRTQSAEI